MRSMFARRCSQCSKRGRWTGKMFAMFTIMFTMPKQWNMDRWKHKDPNWKCCLRIVFNTLWYYYCIARKVNLGLVICLRTQITLDYLYIAQGGYQSAIYQHTFSTAGLMTTWSWRPPSPMCLGKKPKNHVELRERIHSFNPPPPASASCVWYIVHTGLKSRLFRLIWKAHHGQE